MEFESRVRPQLFGASLAIAAVVFLAACGGGGGGGGGDNDGSIDLRPRLSLSTGQVTVARSVQDRGSPAIQVVGELKGGSPETIFLLVEASGTVVKDIEVDISVAQRSAVLDIIFIPPEEMALGIHTDSLVVRACMDQACVNEYAGSPQTVPIEYAIEGVRVEPGSLEFIYGENSDPAPQSVQIESSGMSWSSNVSGVSELISIAPGSGSQSPATIEVSPGNLPLGSYEAEIVIESDGHTAAVPVSIQVEPSRLFGSYPYYVPAGEPVQIAVGGAFLTSANIGLVSAGQVDASSFNVAGDGVLTVNLPPLPIGVLNVSAEGDTSNLQSTAGFSVVNSETFFSNGVGPGVAAEESYETVRVDWERGRVYSFRANTGRLNVLKATDAGWTEQFLDLDSALDWIDLLPGGYLVAANSISIKIIDPSSLSVVEEYDMRERIPRGDTFVSPLMQSVTAIVPNHLYIEVGGDQDALFNLSSNRVSLVPQNFKVSSSLAMPANRTFIATCRQGVLKKYDLISDEVATAVLEGGSTVSFHELTISAEGNRILAVPSRYEQGTVAVFDRDLNRLGQLPVEPNTFVALEISYQGDRAYLLQLNQVSNLELFTFDLTQKNEENEYALVDRKVLYPSDINYTFMEASPSGDALLIMTRERTDVIDLR